MKYLPDELWEKLPIADFRPRFFVESYTEKLSLETPHFAQSRLMNVFSSCSEAIDYIKEYQSSDRNAAYILLALDEIDACFAEDPVAQDLFSSFESPRRQLFKTIRGGDFSASQLQRLGVLCRAILSDNENYSERLLLVLKTAIFEPADLSHKERITAQIYTLTGLYTTQLLIQGYSPTYLFNRAEMFTRESNYSDRNFLEQFELVTGKLRNRITRFEVYFALRAHKPSCLLSIDDNQEFLFSDTIPDLIQGANREKLAREFDPNVIAYSSIEATDYVTASWRVKDTLDKLLDSVTALELNPKIQVSEHCVAITRANRLTHSKALNINLLLGFLSSEGGTYFSSADTTIRDTMQRLDDDGFDQLGRSLRYLRLARESVSMEQKLLNLWISLESLFADREPHILANILAYVPRIYAVSGLRRRMRYLRRLLARSRVPATPLIMKDVAPGIRTFGDEITDFHIFDILRNEPAAKEFFDSLEPKEHLKFKLLSTFKEFKDNKAISQRITRSETDVARQLRRIYFLRNKIAHTGHYANIRPQLVTHLLDYLAVCYVALSTCAAKARLSTVYSIGDILSGYMMGADDIVARVGSQDSVVTLSDICVVPII